MKRVLILAMMLCAAGCYAQTVTCSSEDGNRHYCALESRGGGVQMVNQRSGSACTQGYSWGYDSSRVWVDKGCRADFAVTAYNQGYNNQGYNNQGGAGTPLTCSSEDGRRNYCAADTRGGVQMVRQRSGSPCIQGSTWGYDQNGVWVDRGCRADFVALPYNPYAGQGNIVACSSEDGGRHYCPADTRGGVQLARQRSGSPCIQSSTWGYDQNGIWVDRGCRADFTLGGNYGNGNYGNGNGGWLNGVLVCSSNDGRRNVCPADLRGRRVVLKRKLSDAGCRFNETWGYDRDAIWVDRGCRAEFAIEARGDRDYR